MLWSMLGSHPLLLFAMRVATWNVNSLKAGVTFLPHSDAVEEGLGRSNADERLGQVMMASAKPRPMAAIFWGGLIAGALDISQAFIGFGLLGATPYGILQHIAGGIFGAHSREMGWMSAALGLGLHFTIAFTAATVYYLASRVMRVLVQHAVLCGLLYGELVFLFMYFMVLPLSALGPPHFNVATYVTGPIGHPLLVGLPIALSVRRFAGIGSPT